MKPSVVWFTVCVITITLANSASAQQSWMAATRDPLFSPQAISHAVQEAPPPRTTARPTHTRRSARSRAAWTILGVVGGAFAGVVLGAALEPDCRCDDPGVKGALIGLPVGAIGGGVAGFVLSR